MSMRVGTKKGDRLTRDECILIAHICNGKRVEEAARVSNLTEVYARTCVRSIFVKLGARTLAHAASIWTSKRIHDEN